MIVGSAPGYGALPVDPVLSAKSKKNVDQAESQTSARPSSEASSDTRISAQSGSFLSSSTTAELLKSVDTEQLKGSSVQTPKTITREDVLNAVKRSKSYADGNVSDGNLLGEVYTSKDIGFIKATTGYNIISIGKLTSVVDDDGNPPPSAEALSYIDGLASTIDGARTLGGLTGEITPEIAKEMLGSFANLIKSFPEDWLDKALNYLSSSTDSKPAEL